jgi:hypothetical protein
MMSRLSAVLSPSPLLAVLGCVVMLGGCMATEPNRELTDRIEFARHRNQWATQNIRNYSFDYQRTGYARIATIRVDVLDGGVARVVFRDTGILVTDTPDEPTIETLFETAASVIANDDYDVRIEYDPELGFPTLIVAESLRAEAGFTITAGNFELLNLEKVTR